MSRSRPPGPSPAGSQGMAFRRGGGVSGSADHRAEWDAQEPLSIGQLYDEVDAVLARTFPRSRMLWVRGEIQQLSDRTGHCYVDLIEPDGRRGRQSPVLRVKCWRTTWNSLRTTLDRQGIRLEPGMVVVLRGSLDFYRPRAELSFILAEIDVTALLGRLAAQRAALVRSLKAQGLLDANRRIAMVPVPQRIGLVASPGTEGYRDFMGQLEASGFAFDVAVVPATVQGRASPRAVAAALRALRDCDRDLVVVVRGGGAKADLAAFDHELVARAIATMPIPVWTGIGHSGDESVADLVASRACVTPTECGQEIATRVNEWWETEVIERLGAIAAGTRRVLDEAARREGMTRRHLIGSARHQLNRHHDRLTGRSAILRSLAPQRVDIASEHLGHRAGRLAPLAQGHTHRGAEQLTTWRRLIAAYDVDRQLDRGYTLTLDNDGQVLRSARSVSPGASLVTRFADGSVRSAVQSRELVQPNSSQSRDGSDSSPTGEVVK